MKIPPAQTTLPPAPTLAASELSLRRVLTTWWPLAGSWLLMGAEGPALSAVVARLAEPEINLAAYGGIVFPLALIIESPIIMLLAASTALSKDWASYQKIYRFMMVMGAALTALHALVAFTPLYDVVARDIIGAPEEIIGPARIGLQLFLPWTWSIAYRRFHQGLLIRFGHSDKVGVGTVFRLLSYTLVLGAGYLIQDIPGIVVASAAVAFGVINEAIYAGIAVRSVRDGELRAAPPVPEALTLRTFLAFYIPLAMTSLLTLIANPIGSAALSRMPQALVSLAVWPVVNGVIFLLRSMGVAFNEVAVALLDEPGAVKSLRRFTFLLAAFTTIALLLVTATPLSGWWFQRISALSPELAELARSAMWFALPLPALSVLQSWFQGILLNTRRTRGISESVAIYLVTIAALLIAGVVWGGTTGLYVGLGAASLAMLAQTLWLWFRSRPALGEILARQENGTAESSRNGAHSV